MEDLPAWPASVFEDPTSLEMTRTGLATTKNKEFAATVKKWCKAFLLANGGNFDIHVDMQLFSIKLIFVLYKKSDIVSCCC